MMETRGLVERTSCNSDGRGLWITITSDGRAAIEAAAPRHVADSRRLMIDQLTRDQVRALGEITEKILANMPDPRPNCDG